MIGKVTGHEVAQVPMPDIGPFQAKTIKPMTKEEQIAFTEDFCGQLRREMLKAVENGQQIRIHAHAETVVDEAERNRSDTVRHRWTGGSKWSVEIDPPKE